jgi:hypothetical protein
LSGLPVPRRLALANPVPPMSDEPLLGWLVRTSQSQGYWSIRLIEELAGAPVAMMETEELAAKVAEMLRCGVNEVHRRARHRVFVTGTSYRQAQSRVRYFEHELSEQHLANRPRVCPICLQESAYIRGVWYLSLYRVCESHRVWLIDSCSQCEQPLAHGRHSVSSCACGQVLPGVKTRGASALAALVSRFISAGFSRDENLEPSEHHTLRSLELNHRLDLVAALMVGGTTPHVESLEGSLARWQSSSVMDLEGAVDHAGALLQNWPKALEAELADAMKSLPKGASILRRRGRALSTWIGWEFPKELGFLDDIIERTVRDRWSRYIQERSKHGEVSLYEAKETLGQCKRKSKGYPGSAANAPYDPVEAIPVGDGAAILGTDVGTILQLFPTWHLSRTRGLNGKPTTPRVVLGADVFGIRALLSGMNMPWADDPTSQYITFDEARHACSLLNVHVSQLVEVLVSGAVRICEPRRSVFRLQDTFINDTEFSKWLWKAAQQAATSSIRVDVARQILKLNEQTFERLIAEKIIPVEPKLSPLDTRKISLEAVFQALGKIRILKRIEVFCGIQSAALSKCLSDEGAKTLALPPPQHGRARQLRIVLTEELLLPGVRRVLGNAAQCKWYPGERDTGSAII